MQFFTTLIAFIWAITVIAKPVQTTTSTKAVEARGLGAACAIGCPFWCAAATIAYEICIAACLGGCLAAGVENGEDMSGIAVDADGNAIFSDVDQNEIATFAASDLFHIENGQLIANDGTNIVALGESAGQP